MTSAPCAALVMAMNRISLQPACILHRVPYRNTSALIEAFTPEYGRVGLVARGVFGRKSRWQGLLQPFIPLLLSWQGRGELYTLTDAEPNGRDITLPGREVLSAFYLNELLMRLTQRMDAHPGLYALYMQSLARLRNEEPEQVLRVFERGLLQELGYGLNLTEEAESGVAVQAGRAYRFMVERGPVPAAADEEGLVVDGATLLALAAGRLPDRDTRRDAKRLMREILGFYLGDKPLKTRSLHWPRRAEGRVT